MMMCMIAGCGDDGTKVEEPARPSITRTSPQDGSTGVNLNPLVQVWFDQALDEATIDSASFHVAGARTARLEYTEPEHIIRLYLNELLEPDSTYRVLVESGISNTGGNPMLSDFTFSFTTGALDCAHTEDYLEPNDDIASASEIEIVQAYPLLSSCGGGEGEDHCKFTLQDTVRVTARIEHVYSDVDNTTWYVRFKRANGDDYFTVMTYISADFDLNVRHTFLPGTYYLQTGNAEGSEAIAVYNLIIQVSAPCPDDTLEDNDFLDEASPISPGLSEGLRGCYRDRDYFSVGLVSGQILTARVTAVPPEGKQRTLAILDPDGTWLTGGDNFEEPSVESWTADQDTTYYLIVMWWNDDIEYTLEVDVGD